MLSCSFQSCPRVFTTGNHINFALYNIYMILLLMFIILNLFQATRKNETISLATPSPTTIYQCLPPTHHQKKLPKSPQAPHKYALRSPTKTASFTSPSTQPLDNSNDDYKLCFPFDCEVFDVMSSDRKKRFIDWVKKGLKPHP